MSPPVRPVLEDPQALSAPATSTPTAPPIARRAAIPFRIITSSLASSSRTVFPLRSVSLRSRDVEVPPYNRPAPR